MSDSRDESDFSSALYLNNEKERDKMRKGSRSKEKSSIVSSSQMDASFRLIKGLIDIKNMIKDLFFKLGVTVIIGAAGIIAVMVILSLLLYLNLPNCSCVEKLCKMSESMQSYDTRIMIEGRDSEESIKDTGQGRRERQNGFFWMSQIYERLDKQNQEIANLLRTSIYDIVNRMKSELDKQFKEQEAKTVSLYLNLKRTEGFEFHMPNIADDGQLDKSRIPGRRRLPDRFVPTGRPGWFRPEGPPAINPRYYKSGYHNITIK